MCIGNKQHVLRIIKVIDDKGIVTAIHYCDRCGSIISWIENDKTYLMGESVKIEGTPVKLSHEEKEKLK